ncbi:MAG: dockerin type I domain-containing protein [Lachnospira sp.]
MNKKIYRNLAKRLVVLLLVVVMIVTGGAFGLSFLSAEEAQAEEIAIAMGQVKAGTTELNVRNQPWGETILTTLSARTTFDILGVDEATGWYRIRYYDSKGDRQIGYVSNNYTEICIAYNWDEQMDFDEYLKLQGFPSTYRDALKALHEKYPKWVFVADHTDVDWNECLEAQNRYGAALVPMSSISSYKSTEEGYYDWTTSTWTNMEAGTWTQASRELVSYAMDPRNFLNETNIFMFENQIYTDGIYTDAGVDRIIAGTFMTTNKNGEHIIQSPTNENETLTYTQAIMYAGKTSGVSPYLLATRIRQEQGTAGTSECISGTYVPSSGTKEYMGYYNYFNIGANSGNREQIYINALTEAKKEGWDTRLKSIVGGAKKVGLNYIFKGQYTLYYQKFDLRRGFWHQYMTNILAPRSESANSAKSYTEKEKQETALMFTIPIYNNMPDQACPEPTKNGSPNNRLSEISVENHSLTPTYDYNKLDYSLIVESYENTINISAKAYDSKATISGTGTFALKIGENVFNIVVTAENGDVRTYKLTVVRKDGFSIDYVTNSSLGYVTGIAPGTSASEFLSHVNIPDNYSKKLFNAGGTESASVIKTGDRVVVYDENNNTLAQYTAIIYGDVNCDGNIDLFDIVAVKNHILETKKIDGYKLEAANANRKGSVDLFDIVAIKNHILGTSTITQ